VFKVYVRRPIVVLRQYRKCGGTGRRTTAFKDHHPGTEVGQLISQRPYGFTEIHPFRNDDLNESFPAFPMRDAGQEKERDEQQNDSVRVRTVAEFGEYKALQCGRLKKSEEICYIALRTT
jgi:hypothetical protein